MNSPSTGLCYSTPFGIAAQVVIRPLFKQVLDNLPGTRTGDDIEVLHDMRVASRRLRAALRVFRRCMSAPARRPVDDAIGGLTKALGEVRDRDVFIEYLEAYQNAYALSLPDIKGSRGIYWVIDAEHKTRNQARARMQVALDEFESSSIGADLEKMLCQVRMIRIVGKGARVDQFGRQAAQLVAPRLADLISFDSVIEHPEDMLGLHAMRISAKRLRYTMEAFTACFGKELANAISEVKLLQEQLGIIHDCDVWVEELRRHAQRPRLSARRRALLDDVIRDRLRTRGDTYLKVYLHWNDLRISKFPRRLTKLLSRRPEHKN